jgi:hypothetical protein
MVINSYNQSPTKPPFRVQTWRRQTIEISENEDFISIKTHNIHWLFEHIMWYFLIFFLVTTTFYLGGKDILIFEIIILVLLTPGMGYLFPFYKKNFLNNIIIKFYFKLGKGDEIKFYKSSSSNSKPSSDSFRSFLIKEIKGIGYLTKHRDEFLPNGPLFCYIGIIMSDQTVIPIGSSYGSFLVGNREQRGNFERLYFLITNKLWDQTLMQKVSKKDDKKFKRFRLGNGWEITSTIYDSSLKTVDKLNLLPNKNLYFLWIWSVFGLISLISFSVYLICFPLSVFVNLIDSSYLLSSLLLELSFLFMISTIIRTHYDLWVYFRWTILHWGLKDMKKFQFEQ